MDKLLEMSCAKSYGTQWGLTFLWQRPDGSTYGNGDSFMEGWSKAKTADALRRLADHLNLGTADNETDG